MEIKIDFGRACFIVDGVHISPEALVNIVSPKRERFYQIMRDGDQVTVKEFSKDQILELLKDA